MSDDQSNRDDDTPRNPRIDNDPALAAVGLGAASLTADDLVTTAAACYATARAGHGKPEMTPQQVAQLYSLASTWLQIAMGGPSEDTRRIDRLAADVIRQAAMGDLDRIRKATTSH